MMKYAYDSVIGMRRQANQDRACVLSNQFNQYFAIVCDGMGGHQAGELAASMAIDMICQSFIEIGHISNESQGSTWLLSSVEKANQMLYQDAKAHPEHEGMGTTLVAALILDDAMLICHVGDSRAYLFDGESLIQLTQDHTYVNLLIESGSINKEEAKHHPQKNVLMKAVGVFEHLVVSYQILPPLSGILCLCSDGLYNCLDEDRMLEYLKQKNSLEEKVLNMIQEANQNGGFDNISVILLGNEGGINHE